MKRENFKGIHSMALAGVMAAVLCVLAPLSIPVGPVPISCATLLFYLALYGLGWKLASVSCLIYILLGVVGMPVFAGYRGGFAVLAGPTGGYIAGYLPLVLVAGLILDRWSARWIQLLGLVAGTALCYLMGTAWFCWSTGTGLEGALLLCVFPFLPGDLLKMGAALAVGPGLRRRMERAALIK